MKKALILVAAVAMGATFTSCKKDFTCKCEGDISYTITETKKNIAKALCEDSGYGEIKDEEGNTISESGESDCSLD